MTRVDRVQASISRRNRRELPNTNPQSAAYAHYRQPLTISEVAQIALRQPHMMSILMQNGPANLIPQRRIVESTTGRPGLTHNSQPVDMNLIRQHAPIVDAPLDERNACIQPE